MRELLRNTSSLGYLVKYKVTEPYKKEHQSEKHLLSDMSVCASGDKSQKKRVFVWIDLFLAYVKASTNSSFNSFVINFVLHTHKHPVFFKIHVIVRPDCEIFCFWLWFMHQMIMGITF